MRRECVAVLWYSVPAVVCNGSTVYLPQLCPWLHGRSVNTPEPYAFAIVSFKVPIQQLRLRECCALAVHTLGHSNCSIQTFKRDASVSISANIRSYPWEPSGRRHEF